MTAMMRISRRLLLLGIGLTAVVGAVGLLLLAYGRTPSASPLPNPNGYDDLRKAGQTVMRKVDDLAKLDHDGLRALVATNAEALRLLRVGLARRCVVPTDDQIVNFASNSGDLIGLKSLAMVLSAEGRLAEMENRPADAARSYVDAIRLGTAMSWGGLMINRLVGIACEAIGSVPLAKFLPKLNCGRGQTIAWPARPEGWPRTLL